MKFAKLLATALVVLIVPFAMGSDYRPSGGGSSTGGDGCDPPEGTVGSMLTNANGGNCGTTATVVVSGSVATVTGKLSVDNVDVDGNTLSTTDTNGNLTLSPAGDGDVVVASDTLNFSDAAATISGTALTISPTGAFEATGTTTTLDSSGGISLEANNGTITFKGASDAALGTITTSGWSGKTAAVNIGGVEFNSSGNIDLPGVNEAGTQNIITDATSLILKAQGSGHSATVHSVNASVAVTAGTTLDMSSEGVAELASTAGVVLDSNADIKLESNTGVINFTKTSLADMGTITLDASDGAVYSGKSATTGKLHSSVNIGGVPFDGATSINLPGVNQAGTVDTSGTSAIATKVTVTASPATDSEFFVPVYSTATGDLDTTTDSELRFNPNTHVFDAKKIKTESITTEDFMLVDSGGLTTVGISNKKITLSSNGLNAGTTTFTVSNNGQLALGTSDANGDEADISVTADGSMSFTSASGEDITLSPGSGEVLLGNFLEMAGSGTDLDFKLGQANGKFEFSDSIGDPLLTIDSTSPATITANTFFKAASKFFSNNVWNTEATPVQAISIAANGNVTFGAGGVTLPDNAVGNAQLADSAVGTTELADDAVTAAKIEAGAVNTTELADDAVTAAKIEAGAVNTAELAADAVTATKIEAGAVNTTELADDAVTAAKIEAGAVNTTELAADAVTGPIIAAQAIMNADINASAAIAYSKMEGAVACEGTDDAAAITAAIAAAAATDGGGEVLLSGPLCVFSGAILKSGVDVACMPETVLQARVGWSAMFKPASVSTYITNWAVRGCSVDMNQKHVSFIDVGEVPSAVSAAGNSNWAVEDNHIQYSTVDTVEGLLTHFSYLKLSCDNPISGYQNANDNKGPCRIKGNTIIGSFNRDTTKRCVATTGGAVSDICTQNSDCTEGTCQRTDATKLLTEYNDTGITVTSAPGGLVDSAAAILVDGNTVQAVEGSAIVFGSSTSTSGVETATGSAQGIISDNAFTSSWSESAIVRSGVGTGGLLQTLSYSQITGNFFATFPPRTIPSAATEVQLAGNNNQTVGNTFKLGTIPIIGNGANFVGNYTAGGSSETYDNSMYVCTNRGLTGSVEIFGLNAPCNHVSIVGNVGTAKVVVTNPQDLIVADNKYLNGFGHAGVKLIRYMDNTVEAKKVPFNTRILGNTFSTAGNQGTNNGRGFVEFEIHSSDTYGDTAWWTSIVISNNIFGIAPTDGERVDTAFGAVQYCFDGGNDTDLNLSGVSLIGNVYNCHTVGAPNETGSRFAGTNKLVSSCNNINNSSNGGEASYLSCDSETRSIQTTGVAGMRLETFNGPLNLWAGNIPGSDNACSGTAAQIALCTRALLKSWQGAVDIEAQTSVDITATAGDISIGTATAGVHPIAVSSAGNITTSASMTSIQTTGVAGMRLETFNGPLNLWAGNIPGSDNACSGTAAQIAACQQASLKSWQGGVVIEAQTSIDITATAGDISIGTATAGVHPIAVSSAGNITTALLPNANINNSQDFAQFNAAGPILLTGYNPVLIDSNGHLSRGASEIKVDVTSSVSTSSTTVVLASATNVGAVLTAGQDGENVTITTQNFLPDDIMILPGNPTGGTIDTAGGHTNCGFCIASGCALTQYSVLNLTYGSPTASKWNITSCSPTTGQGSGGLGGRLAPIWIVPAVNVVSTSTGTGSLINPAAGIVPFTISGGADIQLATTTKGLSNGVTNGDIIRLINVGSNKLSWTDYDYAASSTLDLGSFTDRTNVLNGRGCQDTSPTATTWVDGSPCTAVACVIKPGNALDLMWNGTTNKWVLQACWGP